MAEVYQRCFQTDDGLFSELPCYSCRECDPLRTRLGLGEFASPSSVSRICPWEYVYRYNFTGSRRDIARPLSENQIRLLSERIQKPKDDTPVLITGNLTQRHLNIC